MPDFAVDDIGNLAFGLGLLVPGAIILSVRSQFLTGRGRPYSEAMLSYVLATLAYLAVFLPAFLAALEGKPSPPSLWLLWVALILIGPAALGLLLGLGHQLKWSEWLLDKVGLQPVHPMPTAWDYMFSRREKDWLFVVLKDGTTFAGYWGKGSFASSDPGERDLLIVHICKIEADGPWKPTNKSVWIAAGEIRTIEFTPGVGEHSG